MKQGLHASQCTSCITSILTRPLLNSSAQFSRSALAIHSSGYICQTCQADQADPCWQADLYYSLLKGLGFIVFLRRIYRAVALSVVLLKTNLLLLVNYDIFQAIEQYFQEICRRQSIKSLSYITLCLNIFEEYFPVTCV